MTEEPYRWVEAIQNRREYIENQLAAASPVVVLSCAAGVLFATIGQGQRKLFEIYDRIAMGSIGHPGDIERLRMSAIEAASAEGFSRSADDVSLRRLTAYSLSPALKTAFEQIYGAPFLVRLLFAELGQNGGPDLLLRLDYDGAFCEVTQPFAVISGSTRGSRMMEAYLQTHANPAMGEPEALDLALRAWTVGSMDGEGEELPSEEAIAARRDSEQGEMEAVLLDRRAQRRVTFRVVG